MTSKEIQCVKCDVSKCEPKMGQFWNNNWSCLNVIDMSSYFTTDNNWMFEYSEILSKEIMETYHRYSSENLTNIDNILVPKIIWNYFFICVSQDEEVMRNFKANGCMKGIKRSFPVLLDVLFCANNI